jgi:hypothetical protein
MQQCFKIKNLSIDSVEMTKENIALMSQVCGERAINSIKTREEMPKTTLLRPTFKIPHSHVGIP